MGIKPAPPYANNFMARKTDPKLVEIAQKYNESGKITLKLFKRFLDDIFVIFAGGKKIACIL